MKKVSLILLLVIVLSSIMMAATVTKVVRLTVINKSGADVFIKLTGSAVADPPFFYYLTIPTGDSDMPTVKIFTVMVDVYDRETWSCDGFRTAGTLFMSGNIRLVYTPCGRGLMHPTQYQFPVDSVDKNGNPKVRWVVTRDPVFDPITGLPVLPNNNFGIWFTVAKRVAGEPTMEKVVAFSQLLSGTPSWAATNYAGYWMTGCATFFYRFRTWRTPIGCAWRYQY